MNEIYDYDIPVDYLVDKTKEEIKQLRVMKEDAAKYYLRICKTIENREELLEALGEGPPVFGNNI